DAFDHVRDFAAEQLLDAFNAGQGVLDDVVKKPGGYCDGVELEVDQELRDGQGVDEVRLTRPANLIAMFEGREDVGSPQKLDISVRAIGSDPVQEVFESNHQIRCLS